MVTFGVCDFSDGKSGQIDICGQNVIYSNQRGTSIGETDFTTGSLAIGINVELNYCGVCAGRKKHAREQKQAKRMPPLKAFEIHPSWTSSTILSITDGSIPNLGNSDQLAEMKAHPV